MEESKISKADLQDMKAFVLYTHSRPVKKVKFNRDGDMFFTCSDDKTICAWSSEIKMVGAYQGPGAIKSLAVSYNTEYIVGAFTTEGFGIFDAPTGEMIQKFDLPGERVMNLDLNLGDTELVIVSLATGKSFVRTFDFKRLLKGEFEHKEELVFRGETVSQATYGDLNEHLFITAHDAQRKGHLYKYKALETGKYELEDSATSLHGDEIFSFSFSKDYSLLATCAKDGTAKVVNPYTLEVLQTLKKGSPVRTAFFSPLMHVEGVEKFHLIIGGGQDAKDVTTTAAKKGSFESRLFNLITGQELGQVKGHFGPVHSIEFSPDGRTMVSTSEDGTVRVQRFCLEYFESERFA